MRTTMTIGMGLDLVYALAGAGTGVFTVTLSDGRTVWAWLELAWPGWSTTSPLDQGRWRRLCRTW